MKKQLLNQLLLILAVFLSVTFQTIAQPRGYEPPNPITDEEILKCNNYFIEVHDQGGIPINGGVITRDALDEILKTTNCNAITFKFCQDPTGKIASPQTIFLVVSGAEVTKNGEDLTVKEISAKRYYGNDWCPPSCMKLSTR